MKTTILITLFALLSLAALSQDKNTPAAPPAPPKETFKLDFTKNVPVIIKLDLPAQKVNDYFLFESIGADRLANAGDISAFRATEISNNHKTVKDSLQNRLSVVFNGFVTTEQNKFTGDTLAKYHPMVKKGVKKP